MCCGSWGNKESDMTERLNLTDTLHYTSVHPLGNKPGQVLFSLHFHEVQVGRILNGRVQMGGWAQQRASQRRRWEELRSQAWSFYSLRADFARRPCLLFPVY